MSNKELLPDCLWPLVERFKLAFKPSGKGSLTADMAQSSAKLSANLSEEGVVEDRDPIDHTLRGALRRWMEAQGSEIQQSAAPALASFKRNIDVAGASYKPKTIARGDSYILVGAVSDWRPAQIRSIFSVTFSSNLGKIRRTLIGISGFRQLSPPDVELDNYRQFSHTGGRIYYDEELPLEVIGAEEIVSHFAYTPNVCGNISKSHFHALPLTRVSLRHQLIPFQFVWVNHPSRHDR